MEPLLLDPDGPKVVAIGGGHGQAAALEAIQCYASEITALVTVADDGGSSGRLTALGIPPPGDVRRCLLALTPEPSLWSELFAHRFSEGDVLDHSLGNLILAGLSHMFGDFETAVSTAGRVLGAVGDVIPVAADPLTLHATVDGRNIEGQVKIATTRGRIEDLWIEPADAVAPRSALAAISQADQIVIGPGSLYTSLISALKVNMLSEAIMSSSAQRVFVLNLMTQDGETLGMSGIDHLKALQQHVGVEGPAVVVAHEGDIEVPEGHSRLEMDQTTAAEYGWRLVVGDVSDDHAEWPAHDPMKLGQVLSNLARGSN